MGEAPRRLNGQESYVTGMPGDLVALIATGAIENAIGMRKPDGTPDAVPARCSRARPSSRRGAGKPARGALESNWDDWLARSQRPSYGLPGGSPRIHFNYDRYKILLKNDFLNPCCALLSEGKGYGRGRPGEAGLVRPVPAGSGQRRPPFQFRSAKQLTNRDISDL